MVAIGALGLIGSWSHYPLVAAPFGASAVLLFGYPTSPLAQPRNIVLGNTVAAMVSVVCAAVLGNSPLAVGLAAFQAEAPLALQIRRRRELQPRLLVWSAVYGAIALGGGSVLAWRTPALASIAAVAAGVLGADALTVLQRRQRSLLHEWLAFAAVGLAAPFAWLATTGTLPLQALGLWLLCSLFFGCGVALLKLRRDPAGNTAPFWLSAAVATALVAAGWWLGALQPLEAVAFGVALIKGAWLTSSLESYRLAPIGRVAAIETGSALLCAALGALALLPSTLQAAV